ncbi:MAG: VWD domain-containing protein [Flavobacteriia bacterium]
MKTRILSISLFFGLVASSLSAQQTSSSERINSLKNDLTKWDPIRGEWLANSMLSLANDQPVPDRTFPESITPFDMYRALPDNERVSLNQLIASNARSSMNNEDQQQWDRMSRMVSRSGCQATTARTYGDPHLKSFDGATYSFQTVGEFVLAKSPLNRFEIQTRQQAQRDDFSLNTAVAMNVAGDRVCIYANDKPDRIETSSLRVNGQVVTLVGGTYFLTHGGTINYSNNSYRIAWPTGEVVQAEMRHGSPVTFIKRTVQVYPCSQNDMDGLLGNANGSRNDDFDNETNNRNLFSFSSFGNDAMQQASNEMEKEYLAFIARDFARKYRITQETSLFDYAVGNNTLTYTDESFPRVHRTVADLTPTQQTNARRVCEENGIRGEDLKGCIFDQAYLEIPPAPRPSISDPIKGVELGKIDKPVPNVNPGHPSYNPMGDKKDPPTRPVPQTIAKPNVNKELPKADSKEVPEQINLPHTNPSVPNKPSNPTKTSTPAVPSSPAKPETKIKVGKG